MREEIIREEQRIAEEHIQAASQFETQMLRRRIRDLPNHQPAVIVQRHATVHEAIRMMSQQHSAGVLVVEQGQLVGVCSKAHVLTKMGENDTIDVHHTRVEELMQPDPICLDLDHELAHALHQMYVGEHELIPLVDEQGQPTGVVTMRDIVGYLVNLFPQKVLSLPPTPEHEVAPKPEGA
jgi:CBS domain-containing protein